MLKLRSTLTQWGKHGRQRARLEEFDAANHHWLVLIHGGGWRDKRITQESAAALMDFARKHGRSAYGGVASLDYRLSPTFKHPAHIDDVMGGLALLREHGVTEVTLLGHSAGAFLAGQAANAAAQGDTTTPSVPQITRVISVAGIHSLAGFAEEYPKWAYLVTDAFGTSPEDWPTVAWEAVPLKDIVVSKEDQLVSPKQGAWVRERTGAKIYRIEQGKHDEIFESKVDWLGDMIGSPKANSSS